MTRLNAQIFHENFEYPDSVIYSSTGSGSWAQNDRLSVSGSFCDSATISSAGDVIKMATIPSDLSFVSSVFLYFNHICKIEFFDSGTIEYSIDGGVNWQKLVDEPGNPSSNCQYLSNSTFRSSGSRFTEASYVNWLPGMAVLPDSSWWKHEVIDVTLIAFGQPSVQFRFVLTDSNNSGGAGRSGWYIDDIMISDTLNFNYLPLSNNITGKVFIDYNSNTVMDGADIPVVNLPVYSASWQLGNVVTDVSGNYSLYVQQTDSVFCYPFYPPTISNYYNLYPLLDTSIFTGYQQIDSLNDFAFQPVGNINDLSLYVWNPSNSFSPGMQRELWLRYWNMGTTVLNPMIVFHYDSSLTYISSTGNAPSQVAGDSIVWNLTGINPLFNEIIRITFLADTSLTLGSFVKNSCIIYPIANDSTPINNIDSISSIVVTSYDPNFIEVDPEIIYTPDLTADPVLEYTIHFQNTGNAVAHYVRIEQSIPDEFDMNTYEFVASSHNVSLFYSGFMRYTFNNIMLPDSATDPEGSQGFITFHIRPKSGLVAGDSIETVADIYFDYNLPVITNTALTVIEDPLSVNETLADKNNLKVFPNPSPDKITVVYQSDPGLITLELFNVYGQRVRTLFHGTKNSEIFREQFDVSDLTQGIYFLHYHDENSSGATKFLKTK